LSSRSATAVKRRIVAGVLVLLSLVLITVYFREPASGGLHSVQSTGATVLRPFEVGANRIAAPFRDSYNWFAGLIDAKSENERLRAQIDKLRAEAIQNVNAAQQVDDLRRQLKYVGLPRFPQDYTYVSTDVISGAPREFQQQVGIAAGSSSGIRRNDPVVTADGLVGKISSVATHTAQVTLLTDSNIDVSAIDVQSQAAGLVSHGEGPSTLTLDRVLKSQVLHEGDTIVTQGFKVGPLTSIYPYGIPIGTVSGATNSEVDLYWNAQVAPFVHFDSLRSVLVLIPKKRNQP
jgi:rod shape-determining protein MreC